MTNLFNSLKMNMVYLVYYLWSFMKSLKSMWDEWLEALFWSSNLLGMFMIK